MKKEKYIFEARNSYRDPFDNLYIIDRLIYKVDEEKLATCVLSVSNGESTMVLNSNEFIGILEGKLEFLTLQEII